MKNKTASRLPALGTVDTDIRYFKNAHRVTVKQVQINQVTGNRWWFVIRMKDFATL